MGIPKWIEKSVRKAAYHNDIARREENKLRKWFENNGYGDGDEDVGVIDSLMDCVEQTNDPDTFMEVLNNYNPYNPKQ